MILNLTGKKAQIACGLLCCCSMAYAQSNDNSEVVLLHTGWEFSQAGTELWRTAEVPGTVHQDLIHHKLLPSPFYGMNEQKIQWVENEDWEVIHEQSEKLGIDKDKIGVMGFSAGGHLAAALLTGFTSKKNMVNFGILVYPAISMSYSNFQTREHLLGVKADEQKWRNIYSMDKHVSADTSPTFIILSSDDQAVPYLNGLNFYNALLNNGVKSEIRILSEGGHGWWMRNKFIYEEEIRISILRWIRSF